MKFFILAAGLFGLVACGRPTEPPIVLETAQVESKLRDASDLNGRRVSIDGYIGLDNGAGGQAIAIGQVLTTVPGGQGDTLIRLNLPQGKSAGELNLPVVGEETIPGMPGAPKILTLDLSRGEWRDTQGLAHPLSDQVRVTGTVAYVGVEDDASAATGKRFNPRLTNVTLDKPPAG